MKKRYQIEQQRAVQQFRRLATEENPNVQIILPMADIVEIKRHAFYLKPGEKKRVKAALARKRNRKKRREVEPERDRG